MRLFFTLGTGDIVADQRTRLNNDVKSTQTSITFSQQLSDYAQLTNTYVKMVSSHPKIDQIFDGRVELQNLPRAGDATSGLTYHLSRILYAARLAVLARRFKADLAIIDSGTTHYFALALFRLLGVRVAVNFHNVRWAKGFEPRGFVARTVRALDSWFFRHLAAGAIGCSPECGVQARSDGAAMLPYFGWCGQFSKSGFRPDRSDHHPEKFRLVFAGRVERNKGVFDLLEMAERLRTQCPVPTLIDICGEGSALDALREAVRAQGLAEYVFVRGKLDRNALLEAYHDCDAVIVPTRSDFCEGMPLVCAEAVLSGRPVITSRVSNALPVMGDAIAEAQPEDIGSYVATIRRLVEDPTYYSQLQSACAGLSQKFLDPSQSYAAAVDRLVTHLYPQRSPLK